MSDLLEDPLRSMEDQHKDALTCTPRVKAVLRLGSESFSVQGGEGTLAQQLLAMKEESMVTLKSFITKNNILSNIPDEAAEGNSGEDESETVDNPLEKSKKSK